MLSTTLLIVKRLGSHSKDATKQMRSVLTHRKQWSYGDDRMDIGIRSRRVIKSWLQKRTGVLLKEMMSEPLYIRERDI